MNDPTWSWKDPDADNAQLELRYEPGNWGDVLKGTWALLVTGALIQDRGAAALRYLDPFAGAPDYPLVEAARARLAGLPVGHPFARAQELPVSRDRLASTAGLVVSAARAAGARLEARVFDAHDGRRAAWAARPDAQVLDLRDGAEALRDVADHDLVLVDPYDLFDTWGGLLRPLLGSSPAATVLLYLFNKAPRGAGALRQYRALRRRIDDCLGARRLLVGRVPQDAALPRAYHEVLLIAPPGLVDGLAGPLAEATRALARPLADAGAFEEA